MTTRPNLPQDLAEAHSFRVESPRAYDAVGSTLRAIFGETPMLPADMIGVLHRLDAGERTRAG